MTKLYDIPKEIEEFERRLEEGGGELTPELEAEWSAFVAGSREKLEAAAFVLKRLQGDAETCRKEVRRLEGRARRTEQNEGRLSDLTLYALKALGGKLKTSLVSMWTGRTGKRINVELKDGTDLAELYKTHPALVRLKYEANFDAVKNLVDEGGTAPECFIVRYSEGTEYLVVR